MNHTVIFDGRVVVKPRVGNAGGRELVNVRIADNPIGQKNKDRYKARFIECTFSGFDSDRAKGLDVGDVVTVMGEMFVREYTATAKDAKPTKGKKAPTGEVRTAHEIPFARLVQSPRKDAKVPSDAEAEAEFENPLADVEGDAPVDDPFGE